MSGVSRSLRLVEEHWIRLRRHLFPGDGRESVALALCGTRLGKDDQVYCVHDIIEIPAETCALRTQSAVRWDVQAIVPVLERALKRGLWVMKIHSHPEGYDHFSPQDDEADSELVKGIEAILSRSPCLISSFMSPSGKIWPRVVDTKEGFHSVGRVTVIGDDVIFTQAKSERRQDEADLRTRQVFGDGTVNLLRAMVIGVAGCSGTGSWVIEMLARLGVGKLVLVDPDFVERKNLNRIVNTTAADALGKRAKVDVLAGAVRAVGLGTIVETFQCDLANIEAVNGLAICDFLFGCVDSADGRDLLNRISTYYLVPYIDVGVRLDANGHGGIEQICCALHYLVPGGSSLLSRGVITPEQVQAQALRRTNPEQYATLEKEGYIKGVAVDRPAVVSVNGFVATHAVNEMLARVHPYRRDSNQDFRYQLFSLCDGAWLQLPDGPPCKLLSRCVGRGDTTPLLGNPALS